MKFEKDPPLSTNFPNTFTRPIQPSQYLKQLIQTLSGLRDSNPASFWQWLLFAAFWVSIAFFPIGYGFREVMPPLCLVFLFFYYFHDWKNSVLANLKPAWLFFCPLLMTLLGIAFSLNPIASLLHAGTGINKAFILPFIGMECVKSKRQLRCLVWAFAFACFWQGLDGIYQAVTGFDFIMGYKPNAGRLTGSLGDYTVGNYLSLALIPATAIWYLLRKKLTRWQTLIIYAAIFSPPVFLVHAAATRSGMLAIFAASFLILYLIYGIKNIFLWTVPLTIFAFFLFFSTSRFSPTVVANDNRWDLWNLAWQVIQEHPWFGAGPGQYNAAFRALNLKPLREVITISHPHNLYLDILYAHGIIGFILGLIFLGGFLFWGFRHLRKMLKISSPENLLYWRLGVFFWAAYAGWLVNGIFGHDFYRLWWLAEAMTSLGIMIGAIVWGERHLDNRTEELRPESSPLTANHNIISKTP